MLCGNFYPLVNCFLGKSIKYTKGNQNNRKYKTNQFIRYPQVRVVNLGDGSTVLSTSEALKIAETQGLDLVLITENAQPPVAKILDFNKFLYEQNKKESQIKAKSKKSKLKEFRFGPTIADEAIEQRVKRAREFLEEGNRVKFSVLLRGRQKAYPEIGREKIQRCLDALKDISKSEDEIKVQGGTISAILVKN